jgi:hypothetical protein
VVVGGSVVVVVGGSVVVVVGGSVVVVVGGSVVVVVGGSVVVVVGGSVVVVGASRVTGGVLGGVVCPWLPCSNTTAPAIAATASNTTATTTHQWRSRPRSPSAE